MSLNVSFALVEVTGDCVICSIDMSIESGDTTTGSSVCNVTTGIISTDGVLSFSTGGSVSNVASGVVFTDGKLLVGMDTSDLGSDKNSFYGKIVILLVGCSCIQDVHAVLDATLSNLCNYRIP